MDLTIIIKEVHNYIAEEILEGEDVGLDKNTKLLDIGVLNSMEIMRMIGFMEKKFGISVPLTKVKPEFFKDIISISRLVEELAKDG